MPGSCKLPHPKEVEGGGGAGKVGVLCDPTTPSPSAEVCGICTHNFTRALQSQIFASTPVKPLRLRASPISSFFPQLPHLEVLRHGKGNKGPRIPARLRSTGVCQLDLKIHRDLNRAQPRQHAVSRAEPQAAERSESCPLPPSVWLRSSLRRFKARLLVPVNCLSCTRKKGMKSHTNYCTRRAEAIFKKYRTSH